ncbi:MULTISPECIES: nicotinamide riboside transporter PnuC [unclassified Brenneria]|uniref:nicotinamide riboside transporter PnuC n=1 Tax=unclassified Brenneria TaxID=2634434 RepID=UPI0015552AF6|nr:nicotinamide riboside transporter PnuC [Brenneria sp. hezel4-2-4]MEE3649278.1 nicotinamide riboside transporter PnuC [Brenneria sp. HEZEL_4_2_4]NPC99231.1 nicotinamide riboside transporter PnuC [Brenneria sp. hezel4-2-4]
MLDLFSIHNIMVHIPIGTGGYDLSWIEAIGTVLGLINIWLASRAITINYLFGILNVLLFTLVFYQIQLYASMLLQVFFLVANIVGWYMWHQSDNSESPAIVVRWMPVKHTVVVCIISVLCIALVAANIDTVFVWLSNVALDVMHIFGVTLPRPEAIPDPYPIADSTIMVMSIVATILMIKKYVENWIIWCGLDVLSVWLYAKQGVYFMSLEYTLLIFIAAFGIWKWIKLARENKGYVEGRLGACTE